MIVNASANRLTRRSNGKPKARYSRSFQPDPNPRINRPPEMPSTVAACLASIVGSWKPADATSGSEQHTLRRGRERGERCPHLPGTARPDRQVVEQVVAEPHRVEADLLRSLRHADQLGERDLPLHLGQLNSDEQRSSHECTLLS